MSMRDLLKKKPSSRLLRIKLPLHALQLASSDFGGTSHNTSAPPLLKSLRPQPPHLKVYWRVSSQRPAIEMPNGGRDNTIGMSPTQGVHVLKQSTQYGWSRAVYGRSQAKYTIWVVSRGIRTERPCERDNKLTRCKA